MRAVKAKKHLGQHFLKDPQQAKGLADALALAPDWGLMEIGPGMGVLTEFLLPLAPELKSVELDEESVLFLQSRFPNNARQIIHADVLSLDWAELMGGEPFALVGNYPYNISSQIIFKMLEYRELIPEMVGMFQKEVAERLVAAPGTKVYGILSVLCAAYYEREYLFSLSPTDFHPPPKVHSGVIRFRRKAKEDSAQCDPQLLKRVVKTAFNQRRKTLRNALKPLGRPLDKLDPVLLQKRAEQLSYQDFVKLSTTLFP